MPLTVNAITIIQALSGVTLPTAMPITDTSVDPGVIGPGSVTWKIHSEQWLILGGSEAFLSQAAHMVVGRGAIDHSSYDIDPFGRVYTTVAGMSILICGSTREVHAMARHINQLHQTVTGTLVETFGPYHAGEPYSAMDPDALLWVHCAFVASMISAYIHFVGPLTADELERYWHESCQYARLLGLTDAILPPSYDAMCAYMQHAIASQAVFVGADARTIAKTILFPALPWHRRPIWAMVRLLAAGQLHPVIREGYGLRWAWYDRLGFGAICGFCRFTRWLLPGVLGRSPMIEFAEQRAKGELFATPALTTA